MSDTPLPATPAPDRHQGYSPFRDWVSLFGFVIAVGALFAFVLLLVTDTVTPEGNPYVGILAFIVAPAFLIVGLGCMLAGWILHKRRISRALTGRESIYISIDLSRAPDRRRLVYFLAGALGFLFLSALGSYQTYHFTESVTFCGQTCHTVMEPEFVTYQHSPHARVACVECHIGSGAKWMVKAKISGTYQVYATLANVYPRPIPTPIHNLRPARDTCEQCHWPERFSGSIDRTYANFLEDEDNTATYVRMSLKVGGANPRQGPVSGIHWHMSPDVKVEYIALDEKRQEIPWVRVTRLDGSVEEYRTGDFTDDPSTHEIRTMDCIDCHNRPAHVYRSPQELVDTALELGHLDVTLPSLNARVVALLSAEHPDVETAFAAIDAALRQEYRDYAGLDALVHEVQQLYRTNIFPLMKARWDVYPNNVGHMYWPGCFRCHTEEHVSTTDPDRHVPASDCNACHEILAQGGRDDLAQVHPAGGLEFDHPGGPTAGLLCSDCHTGGPMAE